MGRWAHGSCGWVPLLHFPAVATCLALGPLTHTPPHPTHSPIQVYEDRYAVHIVMELCMGGELFERIVSRGTFSEAEAARHFRRMVEMVGASFFSRSCLKQDDMFSVGWGRRVEGGGGLGMR